MQEQAFEISDELRQNFVPLHPLVYRPGTIAEKQNFNFLMFKGGIGDYICWLSAITFVLDHHLHVNITLWVQSHFLPVAQKYFKKYGDRVVFKDVVTVDQYDSQTLNPALFPLETGANGTGMNLVELGFVYFAQTSPIGKYKEHVRLDVSDVDVPAEWMPEKYVVVTTGHTSPTRRWKASGVNGVVDYLLSLGITPVFLGKSSIYKAESMHYQAKFDDDIDYSKGLDLRDKTDILQAAKIMSKALVVVGLDNGLLHLAGTQEVPIVMGLTTVIPQDRQIRRPAVPKSEWPKNETQFITPDVKNLPCVGCQSKMRFHHGQDFAFCYYKDYKCLDILGNPEPWIKALKRYLEPTQQNV